MYNLKGFIEYSTLIDNTPGVVSTLGELSSNSRTYSQDKTSYNSASVPGTSLVAFHSVEDEVPVTVPTTVWSEILTISAFMLNQAMAGIYTPSSAITAQSLTAEFDGVIADLEVGDMVHDGSYYLPGWISFSLVAEPDTTVKLWFADQIFAAQYPEYLIKVVFPFEDIDRFFEDPLVVQDLLAQYNIEDQMNKIQQQRGDYPYTELKGMRYDYHDPQDDSFTRPSYWNVLVYGRAGNNPDIIKQVIIDAVLEVSEHTREEWAEILPDLFITTEFVFIPMWDKISVPNLGVNGALYSPSIKASDALVRMQAGVRGPMYTSGWISGNYEITNHIYKSLTLGVVANPDNRDGMISFADLFSDYILVTNDSDDFNRVSVYTQEMMVRLDSLVRIAEAYDINYSIPTGYSRIIRDDRTYIAVSYDNITYLMMVKENAYV